MRQVEEDRLVIIFYIQVKRPRPECVELRIRITTVIRSRVAAASMVLHTQTRFDYNPIVGFFPTRKRRDRFAFVCIPNRFSDMFTVQRPQWSLVKPERQHKRERT